MHGYVHDEDGQRWLRIVDDSVNDEWDEPISEWEYVMDLIRGLSYYRNKRTGKTVQAD